MNRRRSDGQYGLEPVAGSLGPSVSSRFGPNRCGQSDRAEPDPSGLEVHDITKRGF